MYKGMRERSNKENANEHLTAFLNKREENIANSERVPKKWNDQAIIQKSWCALVFLLRSFVMINWNSFG